MTSFLQDVLYAFRTLPRSPAFAVVSVLSLALGIGANTTIFTVIHAVLLKPLPMERPAELVSVYTLDRKNPGYFLCSYPNYQEYRDQNSVFSGLVLYSTIPLTLNAGGQPEQIAGQIVTGNYFAVLGVKPVLGRTFLPEEDSTPGSHPVAVVSYNFWSQRLGADPRAPGRTLDLNGRPFTIVGVAPQGFHGANALVSADIWVPMMMYDQVLPMSAWFRQRRALLFTAIGRLKRGLNMKQAEAQMKTIAHRLEQAYPDDNQGRTVVLIPLDQAVIHPNSRGNFVLAGGVLMTVVGLVLLVACANVANLLLVRAMGRSKEIAIRLSLGAGRWRVVRQLLTESTVLSLCGGALGLIFARWGRDLLWAARPASLTTADFDLSLDSSVLMFTLGLSVFTGVIFGLAPALETTRANLMTSLKERGAKTGALHRRMGLRGALVIIQVALSFVALAGAGLFVKSLEHARHLNFGFDTGHLLVVSFNLGTRQHSEAAAQEFFRQAQEAALRVPGVEAATLSTNPPFHSTTARTIVVEGETSASEGQGVLTLVNRVEPGYFATLRIPLTAGRDFNLLDLSNTPPVAVVNESMAHRFWPGPEAGALGKRFRFFGDANSYQIVGIARDSSYQELGEPPRAMVYLSLRQNYTPSVTLYARTSGDPVRALGGVRAQVQALDRNLLLTNIRSVPQVLDRSLWAPRMGAALLSIFGALALLLASVGLYGVISYSVSQRVQEIGIRMALGARPQDVLLQVLGEGMGLVGWGVAAGLAGALAAARVLTNLLFGVSAADVPTYLVVAALLTAVALTACYVPAWRATRVDPVTALRAE